MPLPPRIPRKPKRDSRWRSPAHCNFVRSHACCVCGSTAAIEVAHVRLGSGAGLSRKPDDWRTLSLCASCHRWQHQIGEESFWKQYDSIDVEGLLAEFAAKSPKAAEIARVKRERAGGT